MRKEKSQVVVINCDGYEREKVYEAVKRGIALLGGIRELVPQSGKVLLKPNFLNKADKDKAVTTHPDVFEAVARLLRENEYEQITYGDSPGTAKPVDVAHICGVKDVADAYDISMSEFTKGKNVTFEQGHACKQFKISQGVLEADHIINLCKMKSHQLMRITGAVKNLLGCVYGLNKGAFHGKYPDPISFGKMLVDLNLLLKPKLHIMDGIVAMEGNGPFAGNPVAMNVILISKDPVALDAVFCRLIDLNPQYMPTVYWGEEYGLGNGHEEDIVLLGDSLEPLINKNFDIDRKPVQIEDARNFSKWMRFLLRKPVISQAKCIKCGICVEACPVEGKAVRFVKGEKKAPTYEYGKCIRCYCCQEMCPKHAITIKTPWLGKVFIYKKA